MFRTTLGALELLGILRYLEFRTTGCLELLGVRYLLFLDSWVFRATRYLELLGVGVY